MTYLSLQDGLRRSRRGYRIGVTMDDLPLTVFTSEDGCHPKRIWRDLIRNADLSSVPLDFDDVRQVRRRILRNALEPNGLALSELGGGALQSLLNLVPATGRRAEWVGEGDVVAPRKQLLLRLGV